MLRNVNSIPRTSANDAVYVNMQQDIDTIQAWDDWWQRLEVYFELN